ncbi:MAG: spermine synthase, partial [Dehalococcoidia bacterium]|nr:spermine synthase [Dehalococcoidia bacterium]
GLGDVYKRQVLNRYYTREFFREAAALLNPDGVFVIGTTSTPDLKGIAIANRNATIYHTLKGVFSRVFVVGEQFMFYFATNDPKQVSVDAATLQERYRERHIRSEGFSEYHFRTLLLPVQIEKVNWIVRNHGRSPGAHLEGPPVAPLSPGTMEEQERTEKDLPPVEQQYFINSDLKPIGYYYTVMFWDSQVRTGHPEVFRWLLHVEHRWFLPFVFLPLLIVLGLRIAGHRVGGRPDTNFAVLFAVFTTGLSIMALQVALLFSFQGIYGFVYEMVGLIVAIFMGGLAVGTLTTHRYVADKANLNILAGVQLLIALVACLIAVALPAAADVSSPSLVFLLFSVLTFVAGFINGVDFPLSTACCMVLGRRAETSAGTVYGIELFGACIGAVMASALVAPVLGITVCCFLAGVANGTAFAVILICRRS